MSRFKDTTAELSQKWPHLREYIHRLHERALQENTIQVREQCIRVVGSPQFRQSSIAYETQQEIVAKLRALNAPLIHVTIAKESPNKIITPADLGGWMPLEDSSDGELCGEHKWVTPSRERIREILQTATAPLCTCPTCEAEPPIRRYPEGQCPEVRTND